MIPIVILAGGLGTRLNELTKSTPKSLILINEVPFVIHQLILLKKSGFSRIHFCLGHLGEKIEHEIKNHNIFKNMNITFSYDGENQLGTGGAIKNITDKLPNYFFIILINSSILNEYVSKKFPIFATDLILIVIGNPIPIFLLYFLHNSIA